MRLTDAALAGRICALINDVLSKTAVRTVSTTGSVFGNTNSRTREDPKA